MPNLHLMPDDVICLTPDGSRLVWARGDVVDLVNGQRTTVDLGGEDYVDRRGKTLRRIDHLQFTLSAMDRAWAVLR